MQSKRKQKPTRSELSVGIVGGLGAASAINWFSWSEMLTMIGLLALPALMNLIKWRWWPFMVAFAYFITGNLDLPEMISRFFDPAPSVVTLIGVPLLLSIIQSAPFLLYRADRPPLNRALRMAGALLLLTLPGVGFVAWHNPLLLAGMLYPQWGLFGLFLMLVLFASLAGTPDITRLFKPHETGQRAITISFLLAIALSGWAMWSDFKQPAPKMMLGWYEVDTRFIPGHDRRLGDPLPGQELAMMANHIMDFPDVEVIVFPESVLAPMSDADELELMEAANRARREDVVLLIGETIALQADGSAWRNTVAAFGAGQGNRHCDTEHRDFPCLLGDERLGQTIDESRLPMPMGGWRLSGGVPARPFASDIVTIKTKSGIVHAGMSICFEDLMLWPHWGLLTGQVDVMVSMANAWATSSTRGDRSQTVSAHLLARLAGVPLVRAVNRLPE